MTTPYFLAIDVGTSRTAAAIIRPDGGRGDAATTFALGRHGDSAPSAVFVADGELIFGDAAERRGIAQPGRLLREFKRRVGDEVPILAADRRFTAEELHAQVVTWVIDTVTEREGVPPEAIGVTVPVEWGDHRIGRVRKALARAGWPDAVLITEPEAAALHYEIERPLGRGRALAVYDLGGGTFDAVVLRRAADGTTQVGEPTGIATLGGADFDDALLRHVLAAADLPIAELAADDDARVALAALRRECIDAKEALSFDAESVVPVLVSGSNATVRLTRSEFEDIIEADIARTADVLADALDAAGVDDELDAILLTGGSSRIPRVAQYLSERFDRPIAIDVDPKAIIALGAARALLLARAEDRSAATESAPANTAAAVFDRSAASPSSVPAPRPIAARKRSWFGRGGAIAAVGTGAVVLAAGIAFSSASALWSSGTSSSPGATTPAMERTTAVVTPTPAPTPSMTPLVQPGEEGQPLIIPPGDEAGSNEENVR